MVCSWNTRYLAVIPDDLLEKHRKGVKIDWGKYD
jgi:hypothetical protein